MKADFPILKNITYLDNASTTQKPLSVIRAIEQYYRTSNANVHRGIYDLSEKSTLLYEQGRIAIANHFAVSPDNIIITSGTTASLNTIAHGLQLKKDDEVILTELEHHANIVPWQNTKARITFAHATPSISLEHLKSLITPHTKVISINHVSNVLGCAAPLKEIVQLAHDRGIIVVVDGAQSAPHVPLNLKQLDVDFFACSAHKMLGPQGVGVLYAKNLSLLHPFITGGGAVRHVTKESTKFLDGPQRFEAGTPNVAGVVGYTAALAYLRRLGMDEIQEKTTLLSNYAKKALAETNLLGAGNGIVSFTLQGIHSHDVASLLNEKNICVRAGHHCAIPLMTRLNTPECVRASFYAYNTKQEIDQLASALTKAREVFA